jgi:GTPase SAR1 family protein
MFNESNSLLTKQYLQSLFTDLKNRLVVITGDRGTGKTAIALRLLELLYPEKELKDCLSFFPHEIIVEDPITKKNTIITFTRASKFDLTDLVILIYPDITLLSLSELKLVGLWLKTLYIDSLEGFVAFEVNELNQDINTFNTVKQYQVLLNLPHISFYREYVSILQEYLSQSKVWL